MRSAGQFFPLLLTCKKGHLIPRMKMAHSFMSEKSRYRDCVENVSAPLVSKKWPPGNVPGGHPITD
jgi:hypothetical protein